MDNVYCELCLSGTNQFRENCADESLQSFLDRFCDLIFQDGSISVDRICIDCWDSMSDFNDFCEKIRKAHTDYAESLEKATKDEHIEEKAAAFVEAEEIVDESEIYESQSEDEAKESSISATIAIEAEPVEPERFVAGVQDTSLIRRPNKLTPFVISRLENQLKFIPQTVLSTDLDFDTISRFMDMDCNICKEPLDSFQDAHRHYLDKHKRCAYWLCCNLLLETPFDILDHIKYHEMIDIFQCAACSKCFLASNKLRYHIRRTHLTSEEPLVCTVCDKTFKSQRLLATHQKSHIRIDCPYCKRVISAANYEAHVKMGHTSTTAKRGESSKSTANKRPNNTPSPAIAKRPKNSTTQNKVLFLGPNEQGMFECDICGIQFKQQSLAYTHRNKVHV